MKNIETKRNKKQEVFREMVLGTLLYTVVLGFFNDYSKILSTGSYSTTFAVAIVMQLLTYGTFMIKDSVVQRFRQGENPNNLGLILSVWFVLFISKFVFLAVIDTVFGQNVEISGFVGLLVIIACLTVAQKSVELLYTRLGD